MKKIITLLLIPIFLYVQTASAWLFIPPMVSGALGLTTGMTTALEASLGLHAVVAAVKFYPKSGTPDTQAPLTIELDPNTPLITPPAWTPATAAAFQPTPPSTSPSNNNYSVSIGAQTTTSTTSSQDAANKMANILLQCSPGCLAINPFTVSPEHIIYTFQKNGTINYGQASVIKEINCPTGYQLSQNTCNLTNPELVQKPLDGICQITIHGVFTNDNRDPDCNDFKEQVQPDGTSFDVTDTQVTVKSDGATTTVTKHATGTTITHKTTNTTNDTTNTKTIELDVNNKVVGTKLGTASGTGTLEGSDTPNDGGSNIEFPTDYNRESTQSAVKTELEKINEALKCDDCIIEEQTEEQADKVAEEIEKSTSELDKAVTDYNLFKDLGWTTWVPSFPSGACSPITGNIAGQTVTWDFCPKIAMLNELAGWLMNLFGAWTITGMFFRKE